MSYPLSTLLDFSTAWSTVQDIISTNNTNGPVLDDTARNTRTLIPDADIRYPISSLLDFGTAWSTLQDIIFSNDTDFLDDIVSRATFTACPCVVADRMAAITDLEECTHVLDMTADVCCLHVGYYALGHQHSEGTYFHSHRARADHPTRNLYSPLSMIRAISIVGLSPDNVSSVSNLLGSFNTGELTELSIVSSHGAHDLYPYGLGAAVQRHEQFLHRYKAVMGSHSVEWLKQCDGSVKLTRSTDTGEETVKYQPGEFDGLQFLWLISSNDSVCVFQDVDVDVL